MSALWFEKLPHLALTGLCAGNRAYWSSELPDEADCVPSSPDGATLESSSLGLLLSEDDQSCPGHVPLRCPWCRRALTSHSRTDVAQPVTSTVRGSYSSGFCCISRRAMKSSGWFARMLVDKLLEYVPAVPNDSVDLIFQLGLLGFGAAMCVDVYRSGEAISL
ncbi:hypothetical protein HPB50_027133 [Hyalomma asiaticum]|uniref:Uncharacterized protein n=1 Tax=Hyalomma asiaticum TaxID=266040 RepID=A0ACB7TAU7_HYAAI|nr:hypothetical protein HPB50_027133 [Hyalomma asiaticum]